MPATPISNHVQQAVDRLIQQYKEKPDLESLLSAFVIPVQDVEDVFQDLMFDRALDNAVGDLLDRLGVIIGIAREPGQSDADYRISLQTKIVENISQGEPERLITVYRVLVGATLVHLSENYPGGVGLMSEIDLTDQDFINLLFRRIDNIAAAGVRIEYLGSFDDAEPFAMAGLLAGKGFGSDSDPLAGGKFATIYINKNFEFSMDGTLPGGGGFGSVIDPLVGGCFVGL